MVKCQKCKAEIKDGSPEMKICPICGQPELIHIEINKEVETE
jgi:rRNA maturation endonuclease Nob1